LGGTEECGAPATEDAETLFPNARQLAPMLWAFLAIGVVELAAVHLIVWQWSRAAALLLSGLSGAALLFALALLLSFRGRPVALHRDSLRVRTGFLIDAEIPLSEIAYVQSGYATADYMPGSLLKTSLLASPNAVVLLRRDIDLPGPFGKVRRVHAAALAVDEPARFLAAVSTRLKQGAPTNGVLAA
jgi:hypothetical protein